MKTMRKVVVRMMLGSLLLGLPAAAVAQTGGDVPSIVDDNGNMNWRSAFMRLFYEAALAAVQSGCQAGTGQSGQSS